MKIKEGKWYRTSNGSILLAKTNIDDNNQLFKIIAVADTPQELVQIGDLVLLDANIYPIPIIGIREDQKRIYLSDKDNATYSEITEIFTPNSNGDYIRQWWKK